MEKTTGIVIKCKDYSETSQLIWLYTKDFGKIKLIAKGSRARTKKFQGKLDLFNIIDIVFYRSIRGELHTLGECDVPETFNPIRMDLNRLAMASYLVELLEALTPLEDPSIELFTLSVKVLRWLSDGLDPKFLQVIFEIKALQHTGSFPNIWKRTDISNGAKAIVNNIRYSNSVDRLKLSPAQIDELSQLLRIVIDYSLGKRLKSLSFFNNLNSLEQVDVVGCQKLPEVAECCQKSF